MQIKTLHRRFAPNMSLKLFARLTAQQGVPGAQACAVTWLSNKGLKGWQGR